MMNGAGKRPAAYCCTPSSLTPLALRRRRSWRGVGRGRDNECLSGSRRKRSAGTALQGSDEQGNSARIVYIDEESRTTLDKHVQKNWQVQQNRVGSLGSIYWDCIDMTPLQQLIQANDAAGCDSARYDLFFEGLLLEECLAGGVVSEAILRFYRRRGIDLPAHSCRATPIYSPLEATHRRRSHLPLGHLATSLRNRILGDPNELHSE